MDKNKAPQAGSETISPVGPDAIKSTATKESAAADQDSSTKKETCCNKCAECQKKAAPDN